MMQIKVCGPGCPKCSETELLVNEVVTAAAIEAEVTKVTDFQEIAKLGVFSTPAVVIDGAVKCVGKVPTRQEIIAWIKQ